MKICLLNLLITRVFFSASVKIIIFFNIINSLMLIFKNTYNLVIATLDFFLFFSYICITILEFDLTVFINFDFANFTNFDLSILNMSTTNKKLRSFFYDASISNKLNFDDFLFEYSSKNFAILFD